MEGGGPRCLGRIACQARRFSQFHICLLKMTFNFAVFWVRAIS